MEGQLALSATLTTADGKPLSGREVSFDQQVQFMGERDLYLGTGTTDSTGAVAVAYQPTQKGHHSIKVYFAGDERYGAAVATSSIEVTAVIEPFEPEQLPLAGVRQWLPIGLVALVVGTWIALLGILLSTMHAIKAVRIPRTPALEPAQQPVTSSTRPRR